MSGVLKRVRLPPDVKAWEVRLQLKRWVGSLAFDPEPRYKVIKRARQSYMDMDLVDLADDPEAIVNVISYVLLNDEQFHKYVIVDCKQDLTASDDWPNLGRAYAWVLLQRYNRELGGQDD
jgi:hypothetical protein